MIRSIRKCSGIDRYTNQHGRDGSCVYWGWLLYDLCRRKGLWLAPQYLMYEMLSLSVSLSTLTTFGPTELPCCLSATKRTGTNENILRTMLSFRSDNLKFGCTAWSGSVALGRISSTAAHRPGLNAAGEFCLRAVLLAVQSYLHRFPKLMITFPTSQW